MTHEIVVKVIGFKKKEILAALSFIKERLVEILR